VPKWLNKRVSTHLWVITQNWVTHKPLF
jgi:hypothetical protein